MSGKGMEGSPEQPHARILTWMTWGVVALGILLRARRYLANRSIWLDEAMIALNILRRDFGGLLQPLDQNQAAPYGFLAGERAVTYLFGPGELALRLLPFLGGVGALVLLAFVARRLLGPAAALFAVAFFAFNEPLIFYVSEVKQYSGDVFWAVAILAVTLPLLEADAPRWKWGLAAVVGAIGAWASHPAVFMLAGTGTALIAGAWFSGRRREAVQALAVATIWGAAFLAHFVLIVAEQSTHTGLQEAWARRAAYPPPTLNPVPLAQWAFMTVRDYIAFPGDVVFEGLALFAVPLGVVYLLENRNRAALLLAPLAFLLVACLMNRYPMRERVVLFTLPIFAILLAAGIAFIARNGKAARVPALLLAGLLLLHPAARAGIAFVNPPGYVELRPVLDHVLENLEENDVVYLWPPGVQPAYHYYAEYHARFAPIAERAMLPGVYGRETAPPPAADDFAGYDRVWIVAAREPGVWPQIRAQFDAFGVRTEEFYRSESAAFLYELRQDP